VLADPSVPDADVDAFVAAFQASFVPEEAEGRPRRRPGRSRSAGAACATWSGPRGGRRRLGAAALAHPDRVASLTLVAPTGLGEDINPDYIDGFVAAERRRELKGVLELLFADQGLVSRKLVDDVLRYKRLDGVEEALRRVTGVMYPSGRQTVVLTGELDRLQAPALVVWGGQDRILPAAQAEALAGRARVEVLPGAGHSPHLEAANEVNRLVGGLLDELEREPSGADRSGRGRSGTAGGKVLLGRSRLDNAAERGPLGSSPWCPPRRRRPRPPSRWCW
jgi:hypothetical protein